MCNSRFCERVNCYIDASGQIFRTSHYSPQPIEIIIIAFDKFRILIMNFEYLAG